MDKTMTNDKITSIKAANDPHAPVVHPREKKANEKKPHDDDKVTTWSIDDSDDFGGDPYNHTGSFYVPKFRED